MQRKRFLGALAGTLLTPWMAAAAEEAWPQRPVRLVVPLSAGGVADVMARMVAEHLRVRWGQPVVVENLPGAGTALGMAAVARARPDGYTIGLGNVAANAIVPALQPDRMAYDTLRDFVPIVLVGVAPSLLVVNPARIPVRTVPELVAWLKANPGKASYGSSGVGTSLHLGMELFMQRTGTSMVHVPYKGSAPMMSDLLSGSIDLALDALATSGPHIQAGKLRALGVTTAERAFFAPEIPAIREFVPGFETRAWHGLMAPAGTPERIVQRIAEDTAAFLRSADAISRLRERGVIPGGAGPREFQALVSSDLELYRNLVRQTGIKAE
jgi:tripartite-type tricarboxylate transporter receptor subunit TctC